MTIFEGAHLLGILPLLALLGARLAGRTYAPRMYLLAGAFGVSWLADTAAHVVAPPVVSQVYPVLQSGLVVAALAPKEAGRLLLVLLAVGVLSVVQRQGAGLDVALRTVAWGMAGVLAYRHTTGWLRRSLLVAFGAGSLAWMGYVTAPGWWAWGIYQSIRALAALGWGLALWRDNDRTPPQS